MKRDDKADIELWGKCQPEMIADLGYESKTCPGLAELGPRLLVRLNRPNRFAGLIAFAIVASLWPARLCCAQATQQGCTLRVHVDGLRNREGVVGAVVFTSSAGWPEDVKKSFRNNDAPIDPASLRATVTIKDLPPGDYGIVVLHDENKNMKLDRNIFGFPKEGFGFSNNPKVGLGAPPFASAVMQVSCPATDTTIHIVYK